MFHTWCRDRPTQALDAFDIDASTAMNAGNLERYPVGIYNIVCILAKSYTSIMPLSAESRPGWRSGLLICVGNLK